MWRKMTWQKWRLFCHIVAVLCRIVTIFCSDIYLFLTGVIGNNSICTKWCWFGKCGNYWASQTVTRRNVAHRENHLERSNTRTTIINVAFLRFQFSRFFSATTSISPVLIYVAYAIHFGLRTLSNSRPFIWAINFQHWITWRRAKREQASQLSIF